MEELEVMLCETTTINVPEAAAAPNNPPTVSNLQLSPSNPVTSDTLTVSYKLSRPRQ